jgi:predicted acylesterase/phospholipase RssA
MIENIEHLVLSGGGLLGISYIGFLRYLEEYQATIQDSDARLKCKLKSVCGCSAGSIFAMFIAVGYTSTEIDKIFKNIIFKDYIKIDADSILNFFKTKGIDTCQHVMSLVRTWIRDKTNNENITFKEIYDRFNIILKVGVTNLTSSNFQMLDYTTNPDLPIQIAINASIAIPFVFEPVIIGQDLFCDGGLLDNLPIDYVIDKSNSSNSSNTTNSDSIKPLNILGIYLTNNIECLNADNYKEATIYQYLNNILNASFKYLIQCKKAEEKIKNYKIIVIEIPCDIMTFLKLNASNEDIDNIVTIAYETICKECSPTTESLSIKPTKPVHEDNNVDI